MSMVFFLEETFNGKLHGWSYIASAIHPVGDHAAFAFVADQFATGKLIELISKFFVGEFIFIQVLLKFSYFHKTNIQTCNTMCNKCVIKNDINN